MKTSYTQVARLWLVASIMLLSNYFSTSYSQCNVQASICAPGTAGPFNFIPTGGPYAGGTWVNAGCATGSGGQHSYGFITLYITQSGPLNLLINGNATTGFIDVAIFNIPAGQAPCAAVMNAGNAIGCGFAQNAGGCIQFGNAFGCNSQFPAPNVVAGQQIMIIAQNWSSPGSSNFTLQLGPPPGAQTGPPNSTITPAGPFCVTNAPVQLNAVNMGGNWSGPGVSPTGTFNPAAAGPGTHTITYSIGNAPCNSTSTRVITVTAQPIVSAGANVSICAGQSTTLTATGATTYNWNNGLGAGATHTVSPAATTTYTVTGTQNGCTNTASVTVTVNPNPTVTAGSNVSICQGQSTTLTAGGAATYNWNNGLGAGASHTVTPAVTTTYQVTGTTAAGCSNTANVTVTVTPLNVTISPPVTICAGQSTILTAGGATSYSWNNGLGAGASHTVSPAATTTYTVTGTTGACSNTASTTVTVTPLPNVNAGNDVAICAGQSTTLTATGATTYSWNNGLGAGASHAVSPGATTIYTVTGTTAGCSATDQVQVTVNPNPTVNAGADQTVCAGQSVTLTAGGTAASYSWSGGITNGVPFTPAATTTYTLTGTNPTGCSATDEVLVTVNPLPTVNAGADVTVCQGQNVTLTGSGNAATYTWSGGVTNGVGFAPPVGVNNYTVTGTSGAGCTATDDVQVTVNPNPIVDAGPDQSICIGGSVTLTATGATTYTWTNGVTNGVPFTPGATATYTVTGTTAGCQGTDNVTVVVLPTAPINAGADQTICAGSSTTITATGGVTYTWNNGLGAGASHTVSPATTTTYTVNGTDANGCNGTDQVMINVNPLPTATINGNATVCQNAASPTITFTGANGTAPYTFTYTINGGANQTVTSVGTTATVTAPTGTSGTFTYNLVSVQESSAQACSQPQTGTVTITVNPLPTATIAGTTSVCQNATSPTVTFTGATGTAPYTFTYNINGGANQTVTSVGNSVTVNAPTGTAGTFTYNLVSVQEGSANACAQLQTGTAVITVNPLPTATVSGTTAVCVNGTAPTITFTGANGTAPYTFTYNINGGAPQTITSVGNSATITIPTGAAGVFNVNLTQVQDASSTACSQPQTGTATVTVNANPVATISGASTYCAGSTATLNAGAGFAQYNWSTGATTQTVNVTDANNPITVTVTNAAGCSTTSAPFSVTENTIITANFTVEICQGGSAVIHGLTQTTAGLYSQLFTTTSGCDSISNVTLVVNTLPAVNAGADFAVCPGTPVTLSGTGAVTYAWNNSVTNGIAFTPAATQTYTVTGTDGNGCVNTDEIVVTVNPLPTATVAGTTAVCQNGTGPVITFTGANGTAPYTFTYTINGGANQTVTSVGNTATVTAPTGTAGTFTYALVSVQEGSALACAQNQTGTAVITVNPLPTATVSGATAVCQNATSPTVTFTGAAGTAPYTFTYTINGGANQTVTSAGNSATVTAPTGVVGTFTYNLVSVQDASSTACVQAQTGSVMITVNPLPTATIAGTTEVCQNGIAPTITFTGANGTAPYTFTYTINGGINQTVTSVGTTATLTVPTGIVGTFTYNLVSVQDGSATACAQAQTGLATVIVNPLPTATISGNVDVCINGPEPTVSFNGANGVAPYIFSYNINGGATQTIISNAAGQATIMLPTNNVGAYTVNLTQVIDASVTTCQNTVTSSVLVTVHNLPNVFAGNDLVTCAGQTVLLTASGAVSYQWDNGVTQGVAFIPSDTTTYTVIGTDQYGCQNSDQVTVNVVPNPVVNFFADTLVGCQPLVVNFTNESTGNLASCVWSFSNGVSVSGCNTVSQVFTQPGCYSVSLITTTVEGCVNSATITDMICVYPQPQANFYADPWQMTSIDPSTQLFNQSTDADSYLWSLGNGVSSVQVNPSAVYAETPGVYEITLIASNNAGCVDSVTKTVQVVQTVIYYVPNAFTPDGDQYNQTFKPVFTQGFDIYNYNLLIFNRWGEVLFESNDADFGWDGTYGGQLVQDGVYIWKITFKNSTNDKRETITGHVTLIR